WMSGSLMQRREAWISGGWLSRDVIPAQAGIRIVRSECERRWTPAFAGVTQDLAIDDSWSHRREPVSSPEGERLRHRWPGQARRGYGGRGGRRKKTGGGGGGAPRGGRPPLGRSLWPP